MHEPLACEKITRGIEEQGCVVDIRGMRRKRFVESVRSYDRASIRLDANAFRLEAHARAQRLAEALRRLPGNADDDNGLKGIDVEPVEEEHGVSHGIRIVGRADRGELAFVHASHAQRHRVHPALGPSRQACGADGLGQRLHTGFAPMRQGKPATRRRHDAAEAVAVHDARASPDDPQRLERHAVEIPAARRCGHLRLERIEIGAPRRRVPRIRRAIACKLARRFLHPKRDIERKRRSGPPRIVHRPSSLPTVHACSALCAMRAARRPASEGGEPNGACHAKIR